MTSQTSPNIFILPNKYHLLVYICFFLMPLPADTNTSEMLVTMGSIQLEEFYPAVAVSALMRIVRDPSLSSHHTMVIQVGEGNSNIGCIYTTGRLRRLDALNVWS